MSSRIRNYRIDWQRPLVGGGAPSHPWHARFTQQLDELQLQSPLSPVHACMTVRRPPDGYAAAKPTIASAKINNFRFISLLCNDPRDPIASQLSGFITLARGKQALLSNGKLYE